MLRDGSSHRKTEMSLVFQKTEMSSENPEMSIWLFDKINFLEVKALLQIQIQINAIAFSLIRIERVWVCGIGIGLSGIVSFCFCSSFFIVAVSLL